MASRTAVRRPGPRRKLVWARTGPVENQTKTAGVAGTSRTDLLAQFQTTYGAQLLGCTVMRIRGTWAYVAAVGDIKKPITCGIRVFDEAHNIATLPGPITDPHADWMYYETLLANEPQVAGTTYTGRSVFDVRSRRKIEELGQGLAIAFEGNSAVAQDFWWQASVLLALP